MNLTRLTTKIMFQRFMTKVIAAHNNKIKEMPQAALIINGVMFLRAP
jgi:hypothetical protein